MAEYKKSTTLGFFLFAAAFLLLAVTGLLSQIVQSGGDLVGKIFSDAVSSSLPKSVTGTTNQTP